MPIKPTSTLIGHIVVDAVTRMVPRKKLKLTKHPIENGSLVSEHIADDEFTLILDVTFTDDVTPLGVAIPGMTADDKRDAMIQLQASELPVNIETVKESFPSYALLDIDEEITAKTANAFKATLTFEKVRMATVGLATIPVSIIKKRLGAKKDSAMKQVPTADLGTQSAEDIEDERAEAEAVAAIGEGSFL
jgi:hypothetical protein